MPRCRALAFVWSPSKWIFVTGRLSGKLTHNHPCRAIVIESDCSAKENRGDAWISSHCHVSHVGSKQVCSEQISFLLRGGGTTLLPNIVFSHLDSDLPFYLW